MMRVVPKWKVTLSRSTSVIATFWVSEDHAGNVLRQVSAMQFSPNGLDGPTRIVIELAEETGAPK